MQRVVATCIACAGALAGHAEAGFDPYGGPIRAFEAPTIAAGSFGVAGAALADGRLIAATGTNVFVETSVGSGDFALAATIDAAVTSGSDPAFLSVSPDGQRVAFGAGFGRPIVVFDAASLDSVTPGLITSGSASVFEVDHFGAAWRSDGSLVVSNAGGVTEIDVLTGDTNALVTNIGGASAGVAFDADGALYTANGFDLEPGGTVTGEIRRFTAAELAMGPADFTSGGEFVAEVLSGSPLSFDGFGNLIIGGGDSLAGDVGYVGVLDLQTGLLAGYDPLGTGDAFYSAFANTVTGELIIQNGSDWYAYSVPAPSAFALAPIALFAWRRRRAT